MLPVNGIFAFPLKIIRFSLKWLLLVDVTFLQIRVWETSDNLRKAYDIDVGRAVSGIVTGIKRHSVYKMRVLGYSRGGDGTMSSPPTMFTLGKCYTVLKI